MLALAQYTKSLPSPPQLHQTSVTALRPSAPLPRPNPSRSTHTRPGTALVPGRRLAAGGVCSKRQMAGLVVDRLLNVDAARNMAVPWVGPAPSWAGPSSMWLSDEFPLNSTLSIPTRHSSEYADFCRCVHAHERMHVARLHAPNGLLHAHAHAWVYCTLVLGIFPHRMTVLFLGSKHHFLLSFLS